MRNNAWIVLAITGIIIAIALRSSSPTIGSIDIQENGTTVVNNASVLNFESPFNITNSAGDADIALIWPDCDLNFQATTFNTGSNAIGCQFIATSALVNDPTGTVQWTIPGYACIQASTALAGMQNSVFYGLIVPPETTTYIAIGISVTSPGAAGSVARLGIYDADESATGYIPGALIVDAGTVAINTSGAKSIAISETLTKGKPYFTAFVHDSASDPSFNLCNESITQLAPYTGHGDEPESANFMTGTPTATGVGTGAYSNPAAPANLLGRIARSTFIKLSE